MTSTLNRLMPPISMLVSIAVFLALSLLAFLVWWQVGKQATDTWQRETDLIVQQAAVRLKDFLQNRLSLVESIAREKSAGLLQDPTTFTTVANLNLQRVNGFQAINWIDAQGIIRWVVPFEDNRAAIGRSVFQHPVAAATARKALDTRLPQMTQPVQLFQGQIGIATYFPVSRHEGGTDQFDGFVNGVFRARNLVETALAEDILDAYDVKVATVSGELFKSEGFDTNAGRPVAHADFGILDQHWQLSLSPQLALWQGFERSTRHYILALAVTTAGVFSFLLYLNLRDRAKNRASERQKLKLAVLADSSMDLVIMVTMDGQLDYLNQTGARLLGVEDVTQHDWILSEMVMPEEHAKTNEAVGLTLENGAWEGEVRFRHQITKDPIPLHMKGFVISDPQTSKPIGLGAIARDMRQQNRLQFELQHAMKMESVGRLAGGVAHDFNNLLTAMMAYSELLEQDSPLSAPQMQYLEGMNLSLQRLHKLTRSLLQFSRRSEPRPERLDLSEVLRTLSSLLHRLVREDIQFSLDVPDAALYVFADRTHLEQSVSQLILNAVDATPPQGRICLSLHSVADWQVIQVQDSGTGMDDQLRLKAMEPFFTTKDVGKGTGLGLSTVYGFAQSSQGKLEISSQLEQGTTVELWLPRCEESPKEPSLSDLTNQSLAGKRVLLAEDEPSLRLATGRMLRTLGCQVIEAVDGQDGLEKVLLNPVDLIVSDVVMPRMGGLELVEQLRREGFHMPVILATGYNPEDITPEKLSRLECVLIDKPYHLADLKTAMQNLLALHSTISEQSDYASNDSLNRKRS